MLVFDRRRRAALFLLGVAVAGLGIALSTQSGLGATPISSVPWVLVNVLPLSYGTLTLCMNLVFVLGQVVVLRRRFAPFQLLQIPATALFGACIDLGMWLSRPLAAASYPIPLATLVAGALLLAVALLAALPKDVLESLTFDNGKEFALFKAMEQALGLKACFAKPCHSWERGTNENRNGVVRKVLPKGRPFGDISGEETRRIDRMLNDRPLKCLNWRTPREAFADLVRRHAPKAAA